LPTINEYKAAAGSSKSGLTHNSNFDTNKDTNKDINKNIKRKKVVSQPFSNFDYNSLQ
jgi:hypothetical protein